MRLATADPPRAQPLTVPSLGFDEREAGLESGVYARRGLTLVRGQGAHLWDDQGRQYLDAMSGHGAAILGHGHPRLARAVAEQVETLMSCPGSFANDVRTRFLERLCEVSGFRRFFLANSGTEAIEAALKIAVLTTGRSKILALRRGFHGRTSGALGTTWTRSLREPFAALTPSRVEHLPPADLDAARLAIDTETAAVLVEPIQGEGGVHPLPSDYLAGLRKLCEEQGALLIFDEIQTGCGRTGSWFAFQQSGVEPDLLVLAKGLAGGFPIGAVALSERLSPLPVGSHGSTFGGNPVACAAGLATLETLEQEALVERAEKLGQHGLETLRRALASSRVVREVRGRGLMVGLELRQRVTPLLRTLMEEDRILALPAGRTVLRLLPPLVIDEEDWQRILEALVHHLGGAQP